MQSALDRKLKEELSGFPHLALCRFGESLLYSESTWLGSAVFSLLYNF